MAGDGQVNGHNFTVARYHLDWQIRESGKTFLLARAQFRGMAVRIPLQLVIKVLISENKTPKNVKTYNSRFLNSTQHYLINAIHN